MKPPDLHADFYDPSFEGVIDRFGGGRTRKIRDSVLFLPADLESALPFGRYPRLGVDGEIADVPVSGAWRPAGDGRHSIIVAPRVFRGRPCPDAWVTAGWRVALPESDLVSAIHQCRRSTETKKGGP